MSDWQKYVEKTKNQAPRKLLVRALDFVKNKEVALDLGAGALNDSRLLQESGFKKVVALDIEGDSELIGSLDSDIFTFEESLIEDYVFPENYFDLINAQFVLLFVDRQKIIRVINDIKKSLKQDGVFVGQLFGPNDSWANNPDISTLTREEVETQFADLEIISLEEAEKDDITALGQAKHWHIFNIIARKK